MATSLNDVIATLEKKISGLTQSHRELKASNLRLTQLNESLRYDLQQARKERDELELDNSFLQMSHRLASSPDTIAETRSMLTKLIRDIDKCISQLKE